MICWSSSATAKLIAHNAPFDFAFLDAEFVRLGLPALSAARMIDTLALAKVRFPGMPNSLDALCRRFAIDLSARTTHNALLDCRLLADVYVELTGGRQRGLSLAAEKTDDRTGGLHAYGRPIAATDRAKQDELAAHAAFVAQFKDPSGCGPEKDQATADVPAWSLPSLRTTGLP